MIAGNVDGSESFNEPERAQKAVTKLSGIVTAASKARLSGI